MSAYTIAEYRTRAGAVVSAQAREVTFLEASRVDVTATCSGCNERTDWSSSRTFTARKAEDTADRWAERHAANCTSRP